jgi:hypothetical protein
MKEIVKELREKLKDNSSVFDISCTDGNVILKCYNPANYTEEVEVSNALHLVTKRLKEEKICYSLLTWGSLATDLRTFEILI